jgi:hypothetical protein
MTRPGDLYRAATAGSAAMWGRLVTCGPIVNRSIRAQPGQLINPQLYQAATTGSGARPRKDAA